VRRFTVTRIGATSPDMTIMADYMTTLQGGLRCETIKFWLSRGWFHADRTIGMYEVANGVPVQCTSEELMSDEQFLSETGVRV
jgi:hypothetical protein